MIILMDIIKISFRNNEKNRWKRKGKKDKKEERGEIILLGV